MKSARILSVIGLGSVLLCLKAQGALLATGQDPNNPFYADFTSNTLGINYSYNSGSGVGTFTVTNLAHAASSEQYKAGSSAAGTHGSKNSPPSFSGFYTLTATVQNIGGLWQTTGGSFTVTGTLFGGSVNDILLTGNLVTGAGSFGWDVKAANEFDFRFITGSGGNSSILADFFGAGAGKGAIRLHEGNLPTTGGYNGDLTQNWVSTSGSADTFVPEPVAYPLAAAGTALLGLAFMYRKSGRSNLVAV